MALGKAGFTFYAAHTTPLIADATSAVTAFAFGLITTALATRAHRGTSPAPASGVATLFVLASYLGAALGAGLLDEVVAVMRAALERRHDTVPLSTDRAFHVEFWMELLLFLPLVLLPRRLAERVASRSNRRGDGR